MITFSKQYLFSFLIIDILHGILVPAISVSLYLPFGWCPFIDVCEQNYRCAHIYGHKVIKINQKNRLS